MKKARYFDRLRVECNFGSKYFDDVEKARLYFDSKTAANQEVELWLVRYIITGKGKMIVTQRLLECSTSFQPIFFD